MRRNLFLHFLNRDSREIFGLYRFYGEAQHTFLLKQALNAAVLMCEDHCIIPPGFAIEDAIAFDLSEVNRQFLSERRILLPMRERNLADYAEKKRIEYQPQRDRYSGLFSDRRLEFLGANAVGLIPRRSHIAEAIVSGWEAAPDSKTGPLATAKRFLTPSMIESVRLVPASIAIDGRAVTWAEIEKGLPREARAAHSELRNSLQQIYFRQYCREFGLEVLCELPFICTEFGLPNERRVYNFNRFADFLNAFHLRSLFLRCSALTICEIKLKPGLTCFVDAYQGAARAAQSRADLQLIAERAAKASRFDWMAFEARHQLLLSEPDGLAIAEMDDALAEAASILTAQNGLPRREPGALVRNNTTRKDSSSYTGTILRPPMPDLVLYVALDEELSLLARHWNLDRQSTAPAATGAINGVPVDVLSPMSMGRVPAAVEVTRYLERRKSNRPKLILIIGLAGGFRDEGTQPGHILCGETVVDLASRKVQGKDSETVTRFRRRDFRLDPSLGAVLRSSSFKKEAWQAKAIDIAEWPEDRRPSLHHGLVASVDEVVASDEWSAALRRSTEKLLGVEMEAGGVCAAAEAFGIPVAMLRAVSDNADPIKADDAWRRRGMKTIAVLLDHLSLQEVFQVIAKT